jgi:hypothetical protein
MSIRTRRQSIFVHRIAKYVRLPLALALTGALLYLSPAGLGQQNSPAGVNQGGAPYIHQPAGLDPMPQKGGSESDMQLARMRQAERQRRIAIDTAKLVELSNQLKSEIDQSPKDQLSADAMKKADEIEKLAHDLKGWMKE